MSKVGVIEPRPTSLDRARLKRYAGSDTRFDSAVLSQWLARAKRVRAGQPAYIIGQSQDSERTVSEVALREAAESVGLLWEGLWVRLTEGSQGRQGMPDRPAIWLYGAPLDTKLVIANRSSSQSDPKGTIWLRKTGGGLRDVWPPNAWGIGPESRGHDVRAGMRVTKAVMLTLQKHVSLEEGLEQAQEAAHKLFERIGQLWAAARLPIIPVLSNDPLDFLEIGTWGEESCTRPGASEERGKLQLMQLPELSVVKFMEEGKEPWERPEGRAIGWLQEGLGLVWSNGYQFYLEQQEMLLKPSVAEWLGTDVEELRLERWCQEYEEEEEEDEEEDCELGPLCRRIESVYYSNRNDCGLLKKGVYLQDPVEPAEGRADLTARCRSCGAAVMWLERCECTAQMEMFG